MLRPGGPRLNDADKSALRTTLQTLARSLVTATAPPQPRALYTFAKDAAVAAWRLHHQGRSPAANIRERADGNARAGPVGPRDADTDTAAHRIADADSVALVRGYGRTDTRTDTRSNACADPGRISHPDAVGDPDPAAGVNGDARRDAALPGISDPEP